MSDLRLAVLLDLLREIGEGDPARGVALALVAHPELWLAFPFRPLVAGPWQPQGRGWVRLQVVTGHPCTLVDDCARRAERAGDWRAQVKDWLREPATESLLGPAEQTWATREDAQSAADAALLAAGWVLL